jgi:hypothetical protein
MPSPKSKKPPEPKQDTAGHCHACGKVFPSGPRDFGADCHLVDDVMIATCSRACRATLGLKERKSEALGPFAHLFD